MENIKCEHRYSKSMHQDYPRKCILCGETEKSQPSPLISNGATAEEGIKCPFCGQTDFDKPGLKYHIQVYCVDYMNTEEL